MPDLIQMLTALCGAVGLFAVALVLFYALAGLWEWLRDHVGGQARARRESWQREGRDEALSRFREHSWWFSNHPALTALLRSLSDPAQQHRIYDIRAEYDRAVDISALYFEAHVTIDPVAGDRLDLFRRVCGQHQFHVADLVMVKPGEGDAPSTRDSFCTGRHISRKDLEGRTRSLVRDLLQNGFRVRRYKIEDTVLDSRTEDVFELLPPIEVTLSVDTTKLDAATRSAVAGAGKCVRVKDDEE